MNVHDPDRELVRRSQEGEREAFAKLVEQYYERVVVLALGVLGNHEAARDTAQDVFLKVFREIRRFKGESKFKTWLYRIAMNAAIDAGRRKRPTETLDTTDSSGEDDRPPSVLADTRPGPREEASRVEAKACLEEALEELSEEHRAALVLREWEGLSYEEIAAVLGIEIGTVMSRLHYGRRKLAQVLGIRIKGEIIG